MRQGVKRRIPRFVSLLMIAFLACAALYQPHVARADDPPLRVEILAGYNLVVDSNVTSPSTRAPAVATVAGRFCNTGATPLTDVYGYIGNYTGGTSGTPGVYPARPAAEFVGTPFANTGSYSFQHLGGSLGTADATRYIGGLAVGECKVQYWMIRYPQCSNTGAGAWQNPPCSNPAVGTWGTSVSPDDDMWLDLDIWGTANTGSGTTGTGVNKRMHMRNEISAMANKIWPNDGEWFNLKEGPIEPGDIISSNGVNYELGRVNQGFDNDGDFVPDYNAWLQPIGDPNFDPSCFRLIGISGVITATRSGGNPDMVITASDATGLYFMNLPSDNTGIRGQIHYTFLALDGPCSASISPYQEAASGSDNEKFNGDYGAALPPITSKAPKVTLDKTVNLTTAAPGATLQYALAFANTGDYPAGRPDNGVPLVLRDHIPAGTGYVANSAWNNNTLPGGMTAQVRYSTDNGATWTLTEPSPALVTDLQWWLSAPLAPAAAGTVRFQVTVDNPYTEPTPLIENIGKIGFGQAPPFDEDDAITLVQGTNSIGDRVWQDNDGDGVQDGGEPGLSNIGVRLYWDRDGDGVLDADDPMISTTYTSGGTYSFPNLPDGDYIVQVDAADPDLPVGYAPSTSTVYPVTNLGEGVSTPVAFLNADFGFSPVLALDKALVTPDPTYEGSTVTWHITLRNTRPGNGTGQPSACAYTTWASAYDAARSGTGNKAWQNYQNAYTPPGPDGLYATAPFENAGEAIGVTGFSLGQQAGGITGVEALLPINVVGTLAGNIEVFICGATCPTTGHVYDAATLTSGTLVVNVLTDRAWTWTDFNGSAVTIQVVATKSGNPAGDLNLDAAGFRVTTNQQCGGPDDTIAVMPLTDHYDADVLQFLSASPIQSSVTTDGPEPRDGTITWDNLGPLYAGQTRVVTVSFRALQPPDNDADGENDPITTLNVAQVQNAEFANGRPVNDATDQDDVTINPTGSIGDTVWNDNGNGGGTASNGIQDGGEVGIPGVTVRLEQWNGSAWVLVTTQVTNQSGKYLFEGLHDGTYRVVVDTVSLPGATFTQTGDPDYPGRACSGAECDNQSNNLVLNNNNGNPAGDNFLGEDFGYRIPNTVYGSVWEDNDGDGVRDPGENGIPGVTVYLDNCGADAVCGNGDDGSPRTATTDASGNYVFSDLPDGNYRTRVNTSTLPAGGTWTNTDDPEDNYDSQSNVIAVSGGNLYGAYDYGYHRHGTLSLGDTVYVDWDGDSAQDGGEEGIPNITVSLYEDTNGDGVIDPATDALIGTTTTDANGHYSFGDLMADDYIVVVDRNDPDWPDGTYAQTQDYDGTRNDMAEVNLTASIDTVDFGYRPIGAASIGDWVWADTDGDGVQDPGETGIPNITVNLYEDSNNDGIIDSGDALIGTRVTDASGAYLFSGLPAGNYLVDVDTTDADLPNDGLGQNYVLSTNNDPHDVTLADGESYRDADFGFTAGGLIGDRIWQDNDGDGLQDVNEPGISGVLVSLYIDANHDGDYDPGTDTLYATDTTDSAGIYEFTSLPAGDYVVVVGTVPAGFQQTGDPDLTTVCSGATCDGQTGVSLLPGQVDRSNDFGYRPQGIIGDTLWVDTNANGEPDPGEPPVTDVTVWLYNDANHDGDYDAGTDTLVATTVTGPEGLYTFGNLPGGDYVVVVDSSDPDLAGLTQTVDPDATINNQHGLTLPSGGTNLDVDFGYRYTENRTIEGDVCYDVDGDGYCDPGEPILCPGLTVYLWDPNHQLVAQTVTDENGHYSFTGLGNGPYTISYDPSSACLAGFVPTPVDPPYATCTPEFPIPPDVPDFGLMPVMDFGDLPDSYGTMWASNGARHRIGDLWLGPAGTGPDTDGLGPGSFGALGDDNSGTDDENGIVPEAGDVWSPGSSVDLDITTNRAGGYLVGWFDWNGDGDFDVDEMVTFGTMPAGTSRRSVTVPAGATTGDYVNARFRLYDGAQTGPSPLGLAINGEVEDYRWPIAPTAVRVIRFEAAAQPNGILLTWETATEVDNLGFNLYRALSADGEQAQLNAELIASQSPGSQLGFVYTYLDETATPGITYYYWLDDINVYGVATRTGPVPGTIALAGSYHIYLPAIFK